MSARGRHPHNEKLSALLLRRVRRGWHGDGEGLFFFKRLCLAVGLVATRWSS